MKRLLIALILLTGYAASAGAQPSVSATVGGAFASFRDGQAAPAPRQDVTAAAGLEYVFHDERGRLYYDLDGGTYDLPGDWSYFLRYTSHGVGLRLSIEY